MSTLRDRRYEECTDEELNELAEEYQLPLKDFGNSREELLEAIYETERELEDWYASQME